MPQISSASKQIVEQARQMRLYYLAWLREERERLTQELGQGGQPPAKAPGRLEAQAASDLKPGGGDLFGDD